MDADFTFADVQRASFRGTTVQGFKKEQLYATESYRSGDLNGIDLSDDDLSGWGLSRMKLAGALFRGSDLWGRFVVRIPAERRLAGRNFTGAFFPVCRSTKPVRG